MGPRNLREISIQNNLTDAGLLFQMLPYDITIEELHDEIGWLGKIFSIIIIRDSSIENYASAQVIYYDKSPGFLKNVKECFDGVKMKNHFVLVDVIELDIFTDDQSEKSFNVCGKENVSRKTNITKLELDREMDEYNAQRGRRKID